jgi:hypothetical protein
VDALPDGGVVIDVGAGGGAGSLPLAPPASRIIAVDESEAMLQSFAESAERRGIPHEEHRGTWPKVADTVPVGDVVVCHHVFYNVADLVPFAAALTSHARRRVVVEMTDEHPLVATGPLWRRFWNIDRPSGPTADDARAVLEEAGFRVTAERFERPSRWVHVDRAEWIAFTRRRLCLPSERDPEVDEAVGDSSYLPRDCTTLWWEGGG